MDEKNQRGQKRENSFATRKSEMKFFCRSQRKKASINKYVRTLRTYQTCQLVFCAAKQSPIQAELRLHAHFLILEEAVFCKRE